MEDILVPLAFFATVFGALYVYYTTRNKERLALIEKGADPKLFKTKDAGSAFRTLKFGLFFIGIAIGIIAGYLAGGEGNGKMDEVPAYFSMIFLFGGLALVGSYFLPQKRSED